MSETLSMTLTEFLLARIAEDEATARYAETCGAPTDQDFPGWWLGHYQHANRHSPARILIDCEAKRQIVEMAAEATGLDIQVDSEFRVEFRDDATEPYLGDQMLRALASVYADHPDFRDEWRA